MTAARILGIVVLYISRGRFTTDVVKGMVAKPENREEAHISLFKSVGGKLIGYHLAGSAMFFSRVGPTSLIPGRPHRVPLSDAATEHRAISSSTPDGTWFA